MNRASLFQHFLEHFAIQSPPLTLSDDNVTFFSSSNPPLSQDLIRKFLQQGERSEDYDELTEYIPCCRIPETGHIHAVIYWRGRLLEYDYIISTFNKNGVLISKKVIAGLRSDGETVKRSVATIDGDWIINIVAGEKMEKDSLYDPRHSQAMSMELLSSGEIIFSLQEQ